MKHASKKYPEICKKINDRCLSNKHSFDNLQVEIYYDGFGTYDEISVRLSGKILIENSTREFFSFEKSSAEALKVDEYLINLVDRIIYALDSFANEERIKHDNK